MATLFNKEESLCDRFGNRCKRRNTCDRHEKLNRDGWVLTYWQEFGKHCDHFQIIPKTKDPEKIAEEAREHAAEVRERRKDF